jgi:hypothetical protein
MDYDIIKSNEYMMLEEYIQSGIIKTFRTKKEAQKYASFIGWYQYQVVKVERRFETIWIVAQSHIQNDIIAGMEFKKYNCPTGKYEFKNGSNQMIVLEVKKYIEKKAV